MKIFLFFLILLSCTKVADKGIPLVKPPEPVLDRLETEATYTEKIDVMVAFLWPREVKTETQRSAIRAIIAGSRSMKDLQEEYFRKKLVLARAWKVEECDCVLNGLCDDTPPETTMERCSELEEETFANERALPAIYEIVEKMKADLALAGGEWLKTHSDFPEGPVSELSFETSKMRLTVFGAEATEYEAVPFVLRRTSNYERFLSQFTDKHGRGEWEFDLVIQRTPEALKFQGKLFLRKDSSEREGIVYWMNPVVI